MNIMQKGMFIPHPAEGTKIQPIWRNMVLTITSPSMQWVWPIKKWTSLLWRMSVIGIFSTYQAPIRGWLFLLLLVIF